jgi:hypothetical protein
MYGANTEQSVVEDERREEERGSLRNILMPLEQKWLLYLLSFAEMLKASFASLPFMISSKSVALLFCAWAGTTRKLSEFSAFDATSGFLQV